MKHFDQRDGRVLRVLDVDSQQSIADVANALGLTRDQVTYCLRRLEADGIITKFAVSINPY